MQIKSPMGSFCVHKDYCDSHWFSDFSDSCQTLMTIKDEFFSKCIQNISSNFLKGESSGGNPIIPLLHSRGMVGGGVVTLRKSDWPEQVVSFPHVSFCNTRGWLLVAAALPSELTRSTERMEDSCPFPICFADLICLIWDNNLLSLSPFLFVEDHEQFRFKSFWKMLQTWLHV